MLFEEGMRVWDSIRCEWGEVTYSSEYSSYVDVQFDSEKSTVSYEPNGHLYTGRSKYPVLFPFEIDYGVIKEPLMSVRVGDPVMVKSGRDDFKIVYYLGYNEGDRQGDGVFRVSEYRSCLKDLVEYEKKTSGYPVHNIYPLYSAPVVEECDE